MDSTFSIRLAEEADTPLILRFIRELAEYEHLLHEVVADEDTLRTWIFQKSGAQVLIAQEGPEPVGFALYFHNFSTFLGKCGLYLEDLYVRPEHRGKGYGLALLKRLADADNAAVAEYAEDAAYEFAFNAVALDILIIKEAHERLRHR